MADSAMRRRAIGEAAESVRRVGRDT